MQTTQDPNMQTFETPHGLISGRTDGDAKMVAYLEKHGSFFESDFAMMRAFVGPEDEVLDVGANIGGFSIPLSRVARRVHAFEPIGTTADVLQYNIEQNNISNVVLNRMGLGRAPGTLYARLLPDAGHNSLAPEGEGERVPVSTIDAYTKTIPVSFIKLDIEGMEADALAGAQACIKRDRPVIFFEVHKGAMEAYHVTFAMFRELLPEYAFFFNLGTTQDGTYRLGKLPSLAVLRFASGTLNALAVPREKVHFAYVGSAQTLLTLAVRKARNTLVRFARRFI